MDMPDLHVRGWVSGAALLTLACATPDASAPTAMVRDSAGITIVENEAPGPATPKWTLTAEPTLELGVVDGDPAQQFNGVVSALRLSDGRLVIGDSGSKEVRFFTADGRHLRTVAGPGEGPGELRSLIAVSRFEGDTLIVSDWPIGQWHWFTAEGDFLERTRYARYFGGQIGRPLPDGSLLADVYERGSYGNELEAWMARSENAEFRPAGHIVRVARGGGAPDTLRTILGEEWFKTGEVRVSLAARPKPFARNTLVAWNTTHFVVGETGRRELEAWTYEGTLQRLIRWKGTAPPVTATDRREHRDRLLNSIRRPDNRPRFERWLAEVPYPERKPTFAALTTDREGRFWVREWAEAGAATDRWLVFDADGQLEATLDAPAGHTILEIGEDYVLSVWKDELDVEYVRMFGLRRAG